MTTEYRPGIPSHAHIEAATRLGLEWEEGRHSNRRWRFEMRGDELWCDFCSDVSEWELDLEPLSSGRITDRADIEQRSFRPIRPYGTPVDWETLDAEVARVGQQGQPLVGRDADGSQFAINTDGSRSPLPTQPWGFRADLWRRISRHFTLERVSVLSEIQSIDSVCIRTRTWQWGWGTADREAPTQQQRADILTRWTVYQELKPLYDLVDGAQGEAAMPRDVVTEWARQARGGENIRPDWALVRTAKGLLGRTTNQQGGIISWSDAENWLGQPLRNFAAVLDAVAEARVRARQGTPESDITTRMARQAVGLNPDGTVSSATPQPFFDAPQTTAQPGQFSNNPATAPVTEAGLRQVLASLPATPLTQAADAPLPRFTTDELDDVDHSRTTKLDQDTLCRGKLPTVEQIAKYREVRARRTGGTVADALKESRIDCEVAQYVLERWAGGLGDAQVPWLIVTAEGTGRLPGSYARSVIDERVQNELRKRDTLDTSEKPSPTVQRERQEAEERRQRLAELRQRLAAERAAAPQEMAKQDDTVSRFDLIEPDPHADPTASIRAWEARQAAAERVKAKVAAMPVKPAAVPRRPAIEVVDAETDGLSRGDVVWALLGRAMHGGC